MDLMTFKANCRQVSDPLRGRTMPKDWRDVNEEFDRRLPKQPNPFTTNSVGWRYSHLPNPADVQRRLREEREQNRQALTPRQKRMLKRTDGGGRR